MPITKIDGLGDIGIVTDIPPFSLPDNAISFAQNVRVDSGRLRAFAKEEALRTSFANAKQIFSEFLSATQDSGTVLVCGDSYVQSIQLDPLNDVNITGAAVSPGLLDKWSVAPIAAMWAINPGFEAASGGPQIWQANNSLYGPMQDMMWDRGASQTWRAAGYTAAVMRAFRGVFVALNFNGPAEAARPFGVRLAWSDFMGPNDLQPDWVPSASNNAGLRYLSETPGPIIDGARLRDDMIIYKVDAQVVMSFTESGIVFTFRYLPNYLPPIASECVATFEDAHVILSEDDISVFDGNTFASVLHKRIKDYWREAMAEEPFYRRRSYARHNPRDNEIWCCRPRNPAAGGDGQTVDEAIVYNYRDGTITLRDTNGMVDMAFGNITTGFLGGQTKFFGLTSANVFGMAEDYAGGNGSIAERNGLILTDPKTRLRSLDYVFRLTNVRPYITTSPPGSTVSITIGAAMTPDGAYTEEPAQTFNPQTQNEIDVRAAGHYFSWKVDGTNVDWRMTAIEFVYEIQRGN